MFAVADKWQERAAELLVVLLLCIQPLYLNAERYINLTWHKFLFFVVCMCFVIAAVIAVWAYRITRDPRLTPRSGLSIADCAVLCFAAVTIISALFSPFKRDVNVWVGIPEPDGRYDGAITQLLYVAAYFIISRWYKPRTRDFVIFGASSVLVSAIGILQFYGMDFLKLWPVDRVDYRVPNLYEIFFRSTLGNVDIVSTYVCVAVLLCGFLFVRGSKPKLRPLWLAGSALNFWLMELAGADSGRIGVLAAVILALVFIVENPETLGRFVILGVSWIAVYSLQKLLYNVNVLGERTVQSLLPYAGAALALIVIGLLLIVLPTRRDGKTLVAPLTVSEAQDAGAGSKGVRILNNGEARESPVKWKLGVLLTVVFIAAAVCGVEVLGKREAETENPGRIYEMREVLHGNLSDELATYRIYIWRHALSVFPEHPIIGSGPDTFPNVFPEDAQGIVGEHYDKAHNEYLQILICQGILGLVCYLVFLGAVLVKSVPGSFRDPVKMAVIAAFAGYCVQAFFNISLPIASQMLWVFAGMLSRPERAGSTA